MGFYNAAISAACSALAGEKATAPGPCMETLSQSTQINGARASQGSMEVGNQQEGSVFFFPLFLLRSGGSFSVGSSAAVSVDFGLGGVYTSTC